jgi:sulfoxide reductase heme-binding subunit YedZ
MTVWYIARGAGLAALVLLTLTTSLGALATGRGKPATRVVLSYVHRVTAALGLGVLLLHIGTILADRFAHVSLSSVVIPFTAGYRPTWVGVGTLAVYTFLLVATVGLARGRMAASAVGAKLWRGLHALAYVGWGLAMLHGINAGTDRGVGWVRLLYVACGAAVAASVAVRIGLERRPDLVRPDQPPRTPPRTPQVTR